MCAALMIAGLATSACGTGQPQRDGAGNITASQDANIFFLKTGDCVSTAGQTEGTISSMPVVPCDQPHKGEVFAETKLPDGAYPGDTTVSAQSETFCRGEFQKFIGVDYDSSTLDMSPVYPRKDGWDNLKDRTVQCIVFASTDTVGTLQGANR
jgi:hypothetical protein